MFHEKYIKQKSGLGSTEDLFFMIGSSLVLYIIQCVQCLYKLRKAVEQNIASLWKDNLWGETTCHGNLTVWKLSAILLMVLSHKIMCKQT